jgi:hypothetical protein
LEVEQRQFKRYVVLENEYEVFSRELGIIGNLKDISEGGLAYQYVPIDGGGSLSEVIDILGKAPDRTYLQGLVCKRIYDILEFAADRTFKGMEIRLRGLEFNGLSDKQRHKVAELIGKCETG